MNFKQKLQTGEPLLGTFLKTPAPVICETLGRTELDVICIDAEHAPFDRATIDLCILAFRSVNMPCIVRIPARRAEYILNALDCGADGILAPHILTADDARFIAEKSHFGSGRGYASSSRAADYGAKTMSQHIEDSAKRTTTIIQIEDAEALDNLDGILSVNGIDCVFIGRSDLTVSLGYKHAEDPQLIATIEDICKAAKAAGRAIGMFTPQIDEIPHWRALGTSLFLLGTEQSFMLRGAADFGAQVRAKF